MKKLYCHWDLVRFVKEEHILKDEGRILSVTESNKYELMIFLKKTDDGSGYDVRVHKARPTDKYVPHKYGDKVRRVEENDEYATFFFDDFNSARDFASRVLYLHKEYRARPVKEIGS